jgi:hypothetical protein
VSIENGDMPAMPVESEFCGEIGLTKRELFAAMAMHALIASGAYEPTNPFLFETAALAADALLSELAKKAGAS